MSIEGTDERDYLIEVEKELTRYEHPLFAWQARRSDSGVEVIIRLKQAGVHDDPYVFCLTPRELNARAFEWDFQRQLYNYLHDYLIEMFTKSPHIKEY
jgi:hypothetical protein